MLDGLIIAAAFLFPTLALIWFSRRPRRVNLTVFFVAGGLILSWGLFSFVTRPGWLPCVFIVQGLCFIVFGKEMRRATRSSRSAAPKV